MNFRNRYSFAIVLSLLAVSLLGYLMLPRLSVRWQPSAVGSRLSVSYNWFGAAPQALEQRVTAPLEAAFALLPGVDKITSVSSNGSGQIDLSINPDVDSDFIRFNVAAQIRRVYPGLPPDLSYPSLAYSSAADDDTDEFPVLTYALSGPDDPTELYRYATENLAPQLGLTAGLSRIETTGGNRPHWRIRLDPARAAIAGFSRSELTSYLANYFSRTGLGFIKIGDQNIYAFRSDAATSPQQLTIREWEQIPLPLKGRERTMVLADLAEIEYLPLPAVSFYRVNGQNSIRLLAYPERTANQLELAQRLKAEIAAITPQLPPNYQLRLEADATEYLRNELAKTRTRTGLSMAVLLLFVLLAYRSWRKLVVIFTSLFVSLGLAFGFYFLLSVELNLYAFAGIAVSFGIMIDNIIIVIDSLRKPGGSNVTAPILGATLTTVASLSVIWFLDEEIRVQLYELARVMTINLSTSVLVSLVFTPALQQRIDPVLTRQEGDFNVANSTRFSRVWAGIHQRILSFLLNWKKTVTLLVILAFGLPVFWLPTRVTGWDWYNRSLGSDRYREDIRPHVNKWLGGTFRLFSNYVYEGSGYRKAEKTKLYVQAALPEGATVHQLNEVISRVEGQLATFGNEIERYTSRVFDGSYSRIEIDFPANGSPSFPYTLKSRLTAYATNFGGVEWNIYGVGQGFSNESGNRMANFRVKLKGYDQVGLDRYSTRLADLLLKHPRVQEVNTDANVNWWEKERNEWLLTYQPEQLAYLDRTPLDLRTALSWFDRTRRPDFYLRNGEGVAIQASNPEEYDRWRLENWSIPLDSTQLNFAEVAELNSQSRPQSLHKIDQQYLRLLTFEYLGSGRFGSKHLDACLDTLQAELPLGFVAERNSYQPNRPAKEWSALMLLAMVFIFFICALLFESLRQAFTIVLLIPISFIGIFLTFYLFELRLDQGGYTSFLLVTGLVVNGLILIVNEYNYLRKQQVGHLASVQLTELYVRAFQHKFLPIFLTILSTSVGLLPFLLGGRKEVFWHGLAAGTIGGLLFSLLLLAFVSPVFLLKREK